MLHRTDADAFRQVRRSGVAGGSTSGRLWCKHAACELDTVPQSNQQNAAARAKRDLAALVDEWIDAAEAGAGCSGSPRPRCAPWSATTSWPPPYRRPAPGPQIPADLIQDGLPVKGLPGLLTVLHDGGYDDRECIAWLFQDSDFPGRAIDALRENRGTEVKRRAQAMAL